MKPGSAIQQEGSLLVDIESTTLIMSSMRRSKSDQAVFKSILKKRDEKLIDFNLHIKKFLLRREENHP